MNHLDHTQRIDAAEMRAEAAFALVVYLLAGFVAVLFAHVTLVVLA